MNADVLTTRVADGIAVITLGSAKRIYFDEEMGDALTAALDGFAGDANVRVVVVTGGAPGYFIRHYSIAVLIRFARISIQMPTAIDTNWMGWIATGLKLAVTEGLRATRLCQPAKHHSSDTSRREMQIKLSQHTFLSRKTP